MQVVVGDTMRWAPPIERRIFKCAACSHVTRQVVFGALPISTSAVTTRPQTDTRVGTQSRFEAQLVLKLSSSHPRDVAAGAKMAWARAVEKLHRRQAALKEHEAAVSPIRSRAEPAGKPPHLF
jgi:hypothetical protein